MQRLRSIGAIPLAGSLSLAALLLLSMGATEARAQVVLPIVLDTFSSVDLDGDGFPDAPPPPIGDPLALTFGSSTPFDIFESGVAADNGLTFSTAILIEDGDPDIENEVDPFTTTEGSFDAEFDGFLIPPFGFAIARNEIETRLPIEMTSDSGSFATTEVLIELSGSIDGEISYIAPNFSGFDATVSYVFADDDEFSAESVTLLANGGRTGSPAFGGPSLFYTPFPASSSATWTFDDVPFSLTLTQSVPLGGSSVDSELFFRQFLELRFEALFSPTARTADGSASFDFGPGKLSLESVRSLTPGVSLSVPAPEPGVTSALAVGILVLAGSAKRTRAERDGMRVA